jgi:hypothetical protein
MKRSEELERHKKVYEIRVKDFVNNLFEEIPTYLFVTGYISEDYEPQKWEIEKISGKTIFCSSETPPKEEIEYAWSLAIGEIKKEDLFIHILRKEKKGVTSWAVKFDDQNEKWSFDRKTMAEKGEQIKKSREIKEGQFRCQYCGKTADEKNKVRSRIISRMYSGYGKYFDYCSSICATHDQFAHEG